MLIQDNVIHLAPADIKLSADKMDADAGLSTCEIDGYTVETTAEFLEATFVNQYAGVWGLSETCHDYFYGAYNVSVLVTDVEGNEYYDVERWSMADLESELGDRRY